MYSGGSQSDRRGRFRFGEEGLEIGDNGSKGVDGRDWGRFCGTALIRLGDVWSTSILSTSCDELTNRDDSPISTSSSSSEVTSPSESSSSRRGVGQRVYSSKMASSFSWRSPSASWAEKRI